MHPRANECGILAETSEKLLKSALPNLNASRGVGAGGLLQELLHFHDRSGVRAVPSFDKLALADLQPGHAGKSELSRGLAIRSAEPPANHGVRLTREDVRHQRTDIGNQLQNLRVEAFEVIRLRVVCISWWPIRSGGVSSSIVSMRRWFQTSSNQRRTSCAFCPFIGAIRQTQPRKVKCSSRSAPSLYPLSEQ